MIFQGVRRDTYRRHDACCPKATEGCDLSVGDSDTDPQRLQRLAGGPLLSGKKHQRFVRLQGQARRVIAGETTGHGQGGKDDFQLVPLIRVKT